MFDKRLTQLCPESKKYIIGNIILQWLELALNTVMIIIVAKTISKLYYKERSMNDLWNCQEMCSQRIPKIMDRQISGSVMSQPS